MNNHRNPIRIEFSTNFTRKLICVNKGLRIFVRKTKKRLGGSHRIINNNEGTNQYIKSLKTLILDLPVIRIQV